MSDYKANRPSHFERDLSETTGACLCPYLALALENRPETCIYKVFFLEIEIGELDVEALLKPVQGQR
jgi:hypothetical protein